MKLTSKGVPFKLLYGDCEINNVEMESFVDASKALDYEYRYELLQLLSAYGVRGTKKGNKFLLQHMKNLDYYKNLFLENIQSQEELQKKFEDNWDSLSKGKNLE